MCQHSVRWVFYTKQGGTAGDLHLSLDISLGTGVFVLWRNFYEKDAEKIRLYRSLAKVLKPVILKFMFYFA